MLCFPYYHIFPGSKLVVVFLAEEVSWAPRISVFNIQNIQKKTWSFIPTPLEGGGGRQKCCVHVSLEIGVF